jgi:NADPH:quinone reductase-like Zn-dependent oxidoreductase
MRAILRKEFGGSEVLVIRDMSESEPREGHAVIEIKAFGLNHAELHMRKWEWAESLRFRRDPGSSPRYGVRSGWGQDGRDTELRSAAESK